MNINDIIENAQLKGRVIALEAELESLKSPGGRTIPLKLADQAVAACEEEIKKLRTELATLRASSFVTAVPSEEYEKLKAEVERLRKAGDAMIKAFVWLPQTIAKHHQEAWNAAKEGKQS